MYAKINEKYFITPKGNWFNSYLCLVNKWFSGLNELHFFQESTIFYYFQKNISLVSETGH